jgi:hypothetical protein
MPALSAVGRLLLAGTIACPAVAQMVSAPGLQYPSQVALKLPNGDLTWGELARFDSFLDSHPAIAQELYQNPRAIRNPEFLKSHPELHQFLSRHQVIAEDLRENPGWFMNREARFQHFQHGRYQISRAQLDNLDDFYDAHPELAKQIYADPSLVRNNKFLAQHQNFAAFLSQHPGIDADLEKHPEWTMWREHQFEHAENGYNPANRPTNPQVANFDDFLDNHRGIDQQLTHDPRLIDNPDYMEHHPELRDYLSRHPEVRAEIKSHPNWFMHRERIYGHHERESLADHRWRIG